MSPIRVVLVDDDAMVRTALSMSGNTRRRLPCSARSAATASRIRATVRSSVSASAPKASIATSRSIRCGQAAATRLAMPAPIEWPSSENVSQPSASAASSTWTIAPGNE